MLQNLFSNPSFLISKLVRLALAQSKRVFYCCLIPLVLAACAGEKQNVILDTVLVGIKNPNTTIDELVLNPNYRYLKVEVNSQPALLVLGYQDQLNNGTTEIWYSSFKEVVQISNGRLVGTQGLDTNWTEVILSNPPSLTDEKLLKDSNGRTASPIRYQRTRTVMPSYRANITETVEVQALANPPDDAPRNLRDPKEFPNLRWVQESVVMQTDVTSPYLAPLKAIYAIDRKTTKIVYAKQCLTTQFCISWLTWPAPKPELNTASNTSLEAAPKQ